MSSHHISCFVLLLLAACGSSEKTSAPVAGDVAGQIGGQPFEARSTRADWSPDGEVLTMAFASGDLKPCTESRTSVTNGWSELDVSLHRDNASPGKQGSYEYRYQGPSPTQASAAATRYTADANGSLAQNVALPSAGRVTITAVSADRIEGNVVAEDAKNGLTLRGSFSVAICPRQNR